jgi:hypothetical protein
MTVTDAGQETMAVGRGQCRAVWLLLKCQDLGRHRLLLPLLLCGMTVSINFPASSILGGWQAMLKRCLSAA